MSQEVYQSPFFYCFQIGDLYRKDPLKLELALEYWCPLDPVVANESMPSYRPPPREVALFKFVRLAGDLLPAPLFVHYLRMLTGLASSHQCAQHAFNLLKMNGVSSGRQCVLKLFAVWLGFYHEKERENPCRPLFLTCSE